MSDNPGSPASIVTFAMRLGWPSPQCWQQLLTQPQEYPADGSPVIWYESRDPATGSFLQINTAPVIHAAVYAMRYRLFSGWHFVCDNLSGRADRQVRRLAACLAAQHYLTPEGRRALRLTRPCSAVPSWASLGERLRFPYPIEGLPGPGGAQGST